MNITRTTAVPVFLGLFLLGASPLAAGDTESSRRSLRGLRTVGVLIEGLPAAGAQKIGLSAESLQTDVELRIRQNGIKVSDDFQTYIYVDINLSASGQAASLTVEVRQFVRLDRDPSISVMAATWDAASLISNPSAKYTRDCVVDLVDNS